MNGALGDFQEKANNMKVCLMLERQASMEHDNIGK